MQTPKLDIYFINIDPPKIGDGEKKFTSSKNVKKALFNATMSILSPWWLPLKILPSTNAELISMIGDTSKKLKKIVDEKRFYIISSIEELAGFENANGFEWKFNEKSLQSRQYYIRHPLATKRNLLIESENFYNYIDEEQKEEFIHYIMAYCPVKKLMIERDETSSADVKAKGNIKFSELKGGASVESFQGKYFEATYPNGIKKIKPRENYEWIDSSLLSSIKHMTEGSVLTQRYEMDFRFGLDVSEAKTLGLDMNHYKKFVFTVHIEC